MERILKLENTPSENLKSAITEALRADLVVKYPGELLFPGTDCRVLAFTLREKDGNCSGLLATGSDQAGWTVYLV